MKKTNEIKDRVIRVCKTRFALSLDKLVFKVDKELSTLNPQFIHKFPQILCQNDMSSSFGKKVSKIYENLLKNC